MDKKYTKDDAIRMFLRLTDGISDWEEVQRITGLPEKDCKEILAVACYFQVEFFK